MSLIRSDSGKVAEAPLDYKRLISSISAVKQGADSEDGGGGYDHMLSGGSGPEIKPKWPEFEHKQAHSGLEATCLKFNMNGTLLGTGGADSMVKIWDLQYGGLGECVDQVKLFGSKPVSCLAFSGG